MIYSGEEQSAQKPQTSPQYQQQQANLRIISVPFLTPRQAQRRNCVSAKNIQQITQLWILKEILEEDDDKCWTVTHF